MPTLHPVDWAIVVVSRDQLVSDPLQEAVHSALLDGRKAHPINARGSVVAFGQRVGFVKRLPLADVDEQAPETPRRFRLRLGVDPPTQVLLTGLVGCEARRPDPCGLTFATGC
jgi:hypothetical protein